MVYKPSYLTRLISVLCLVLVLTILGVVITGAIVGGNYSNIQRFCTTASGTASNGTAIGSVTCDTSAFKIGWDQQHLDLESLPTGLAIHGPILPGASTASVAVHLCGTPSTFACDTSVADVLKDEILETYTGGALQPIIEAIMLEPHKYYLQYEPWGIRAPLNMMRGVPV